MSRKEELEKIIQDARKELGEIRDREWAELNSHFVGRCFRYHNGYEDKKWWQYIEITGLDGRDFTAREFEKGPNGRVVIDLETYTNRYIINASKEITREEFNKAWTEITYDILWGE